jgi:hypothetical protein
LSLEFNSFSFDLRRRVNVPEHETEFPNVAPGPTLIHLPDVLAQQL